MINKAFLTFLLLILTVKIFSQDTISVHLGGYPVYARIIDGDTIYISNIDEVVIYAPPEFNSNREARQYNRLVENVRKVYPYAKIAGELFMEVESNLYMMETEKEQKEYIKQIEKELLSRFEGELKKLTITQGRILIKLIDRETRHTSFDLVKDLRGTFQAVFWQTIARIFGSNLKSRFDAYGEDKMIEEIIMLIEMGII